MSLEQISNRGERPYRRSWRAAFGILLAPQETFALGILRFRGSIVGVITGRLSNWTRACTEPHESSSQVRIETKSLAIVERLVAGAAGLAAATAGGRV